MHIRHALTALAVAAGLAAPVAAAAEDTVKFGLILTLSGPQSASGRQALAGAKLYLQQHGDKAGGKKIELVVKDDQGVADITKRLAQEAITSDKVAAIGGFSLTPLALSVAPLITQAKVPAIIMTAGTSVITEKSPYFVRTSFTLPQQSFPMAEYMAKHGAKTAVTLVTDYGPGIDAQNAFTKKFEEMGGKVLEQIHAPLANPEFAPYLQRAVDLKPDTLFLFVPSPTAGTLMKQVVDRGVIAAGIKVVGTGDITDDDQLNDMPDAVLGLVTSHFYSAAHDSPMNKQFVADFGKANEGKRPDFVAVSAYDGIEAFAKALDKTKGDTDGTKLVDAMKGMSFESPRGTMTIDPNTRDIVQDIYIRKVERKDGQLWNIEFDKIPNVKDPLHP